MTPEQLQNIRKGDCLYCMHGDNQFNQGETYQVYRLAHHLVVWGEDGDPYLVDELDPNQFELEDGHDF